MQEEFSKPLIVIVEDEMSLVTMLRYNLEKEGYRVLTAMDGEEGLTMIEENRPDLALLDWMMPLLSGIEVCRRIRRNPALGDLPIIMLTARSEEADKVRGFNVGADDYLSKPFSLPELKARIKALLRRHSPAQATNILEYDDISMDLSAHRVTRGGRSLHLGPTEFRLLRFFLHHPEAVFSREALLDAVWGQDIYVEPRTVDVHIRRLRKALNANGETEIIRTVRGAGYSLDIENESAGRSS